MAFVIVSRHVAFGTLYLGRHQPVASKASALKFRTRELAQDRIEFWRGLLADARNNLDPKFFGNMDVEEITTKKDTIEYPKVYCVRANGMLTQGPERGQTLNDHVQEGVDFSHQSRERGTLAMAETLAAKWRSLEPAMKLEIVTKQFVDGTFVVEFVREVE